jgi:hypothetical protein
VPGALAKTKTPAQSISRHKLYRQFAQLNSRSVKSLVQQFLRRGAVACHWFVFLDRWKPNPLIKLRILCDAHCIAIVASLAAFGANFDAKPDAVSGVAFDATHDANFVAHDVANFVAKAFARMPPTNFPRSSARMSSVDECPVRESEA